MPRFAVSHINWFDYELRTIIVEASDWKKALDQHPNIDINDFTGTYGDNIEGFKKEAFDLDSMIEVVEIPQ